IYTGFHRTGTMFACEPEAVVPDVICLGKALSGGFPISACVGRAAVMDAWPESDGEALHTSTFLGHPVGCAMALESIRLHEAPETAAQVAACAAHLEGMLAGRTGGGLTAVRGRGAMWGVEFEQPGAGAAIARKLLAEGILVLPAGQHGEVLAFTPPFAANAEEVQFLGEQLTRLTGR
ncbi:MAG: aminotransferase class III-fold pyridoxal phosphate-dependent enzyme, partial [Akkermansiaceae bacterium]|nr:aminotransferase class III-fold pyridoxal phosphate-dependent enzyme [Akkermansiaceae bacterium]